MRLPVGEAQHYMIQRAQVLNNIHLFDIWPCVMFGICMYVSLHTATVIS
jgi:hypothetical protein